jgi:cytochrome P450
MLRGSFPLAVKILGAIGVKPFNDVSAMIYRIRGYADSSLKRYEDHVALNPDNPKPTLFKHLIAKESSGQLDRTALIREGTSYIVAGSDTTAVTLTYLVYAVTRNPGVKAKLIAELQTLPDDFSWEDIRNLPYLNKVIDETLRLYGAASDSLPRHVPSGGAQLAGYNFPAGVTVSTHAYTLHRDPQIFNDPLRYYFFLIQNLPKKSVYLQLIDITPTAGKILLKKCNMHSCPLAVELEFALDSI